MNIISFDNCSVKDCFFRERDVARKKTVFYKLTRALVIPLVTRTFDLKPETYDLDANT